MKIAIIGAGFAGLAAGYYLTKKGHEVEIFERDANPGGLAIGYKEKEWNWTLEQHYHHWFSNDKSALGLAKEINHTVYTARPKTSSFVDDGIYRLDSPLSLLKFPKLNFINRLRMGASIAFLRYNPFWHPLEKFQAEPYLKKSMGKTGYEKVWEPLMVNKLGKYADDVSLAWFWARVYKRTPRLCYPEGGFLSFAQHLQKIIERNGGKFHYNTEVKKLTSGICPKIYYSEGVARGGGPPSSTRSAANAKRGLSDGGGSGQDPELSNFDTIIVTLPTMLFFKIAPQLPTLYIHKYSKLINIGAVNLILRLKKPFLPNGTYWLNMCDKKSPILAIVEHTNFMHKKNYNNEHIVYIGNYMETSDPRFKMSKEELLKLYDPWLTKINPNYKLLTTNYQLFRAPFAQPVIPVNYSKIKPPFKTPLKNVYLANIEQVYPWDRGTNYAIELGSKIASLITEK